MQADLTARRALLVEDGESRIALTAARALHAAGWTVGVAAPTGSPAGVSRAVSRRHGVPLPGDGLDGFLDAVRAAVEVGRYGVVFGVGDAELFALSLGRDRLGAVVPYPAHDVVVNTLDKSRLAAAAARAGMRTPRILLPDELDALAGPFVVKPVVNGAAGSEGPSKIPALRVPDAAAARAAARAVTQAGGTPVVQEVVEGPLSALVLLLAPDGEVLAASQQRADRMQPPGAGVSARARTVAVDEALVERAAALLRGTGWWGLAELQFVGEHDPALIDVNGRFYGSLALAVRAGLNLPDLWGRVALGATVPAGSRARPGVRYQWLEGDLRRAMSQAEGGRTRDIVTTLLHAPRSAHSTLSLRDPVPALRQGSRLAVRGLRKAIRRGGR